MSGNLVMKMQLNNKQISKQQKTPKQQQSPIKNNFNLRTTLNAPMKSAMLQNAGKADCGCGGGHR